jgi:hypothetical protein
LILLHVGIDGVAPGVVTEGLRVFVPCGLDGLEEGLGEVSQGRRGPRFDVAAGDASKKAAESSSQIAGGKEVPGEEVSEVAAELVCGIELRLFASVEATELQVAGLARSATAAAVGKGKGTQGRAVLRAKGRHRDLLKLDLGLRNERSRQDASATKEGRGKRVCARKTKSVPQGRCAPWVEAQGLHCSH